MRAGLEDGRNGVRVADGAKVILAGWLEDIKKRKGARYFSHLQLFKQGTFMGCDGWPPVERDAGYGWMSAGRLRPLLPQAPVELEGKTKHTAKRSTQIVLFKTTHALLENHRQC